DLLVRQPDALDHPFQLVETHRGRLAADESGGMPDLPDHGMEGVVDVMRRALIAQRHVALAAEPLAQHGEDARLADAGLARQHRDLAFAADRAAPAFQQERDLLLAADKGRQRLRARRVEAADILALADDQPGRDRSGWSPRRWPLERPRLEGLAEQAQRC